MVFGFFGGGVGALLRPGQDPSTVNVAAIIAAMGTAIVITTAIQLCYFAFLESSEKQATIGKMVVGIRVTDGNGRRISIGRAFGRTLSKFISSLLLGIGYLMVAFTGKKQGLHDMIADTLVVSAK